MTETRNEQLFLKAIQNIAHQMDRLTIQMERIADMAEREQAQQEEHWFPENYNHEESEDE